jgi:hypothetical protein
LLRSTMYPEPFLARPSSSTPKLVLRNIPCGPCDNYQHDCDCMRAGMGTWHGHTGLGVVVD